MTMAQELFECTKDLPEHVQRQILDFALFLKEKERRAFDEEMDQIISENLEALRELAK